jgi:transcriptional regulator with XRE-family HTH domain
MLRSMSQEKLAVLEVLHVRTIVRIEPGELNLRSEVVERIRNVLDCSIDSRSKMQTADFVDGDEFPNSIQPHRRVRVGAPPSRRFAR